MACLCFSTPSFGALQSVHDPASGAADIIHRLGLGMYAAGALITLLVVALALVAIFGKPRAASTRWFIVGGGIVFPFVVLSALLVTALLIGNALSRPVIAPVARIQVIAHQWWWEVRYLPPRQPSAELALLLQQLCSSQPSRMTAANRQAGQDDDASNAIVLANELRIPVGHPVQIELVTADVIHSFWVPALGGKVDMIPGRVNRLVYQADRAGEFRGQCAEYCGGPHGLMGLVVVAEEEADYREWLSQQAAPAVVATSPFLEQGRDVFMRADCGSCHAIRGTPAQGNLGPDLTHVGSRRTIAAATLDNHVGTLAGWIADPQTIKPGNRMPPATGLTGIELRALASYLASLR